MDLQAHLHFGILLFHFRCSIFGLASTSRITAPAIAAKVQAASHAPLKPSEIPLSFSRALSGIAPEAVTASYLEPLPGTRPHRSST